MIERKLTASIHQSIKSKKSVLLLGPRQVGKSTLISTLKPDYEFNLANQSEFLDFVRDPKHLEQSIRKHDAATLISIDEVQRIPSLLNTVQYLIDKNKNLIFILTGSSARKLRKGKANLLPGRIHSYELGPITSNEANYDLDSDKALAFGTLPEVLTDNLLLNNKKLLKTYTNIYLNEEIKAEALTKNIEGFARFLFNLAAESTFFLDLTKIAKMSAVPRATVQRYFEILEDTLIIKRIESFAKSEKRRLIQHPRFHFFDNGVLNSLLNNFRVSLDRKGQLFENLFMSQLSTSLSYSNHDYRISSYRTDAWAEVDIILELNNKIYALELKSGEFKNSELSGLQSFQNYIQKPIHKKVITLKSRIKMIGDIEIIPWQTFLKNLKL